MRSEADVTPIAFPERISLGRRSFFRALLRLHDFAVTRKPDAGRASHACLGSAKVRLNLIITPCAETGARPLTFHLRPGQIQHLASVLVAAIGRVTRPSPASRLAE
jgi:hypothetical protein